MIKASFLDGVETSIGSAIGIRCFPTSLSSLLDSSTRDLSASQKYILAENNEWPNFNNLKHILLSQNVINIFVINKFIIFCWTIFQYLYLIISQIIKYIFISNTQFANKSKNRRFQKILFVPIFWEFLYVKKWAYLWIIKSWKNRKALKIGVV